jgi:hypothetical protein
MITQVDKNWLDMKRVEQAMRWELTRRSPRSLRALPP